MSVPAVAVSLQPSETVTASSRHARVTLLANLKGGVGKTTTAVNLACLLARGVVDPESGEEVLPPQRVLLIDFERLKTASEWLGVQARGPLDSCAALFEPLTDSGGGSGEDRERLLSLCRPARARADPCDPLR